MGSNEVFEAISHPLRTRILKILAMKPMGFNDLKRTIRIESSGELAFHLKKIECLLDKDPQGHYTLNEMGYTALQAVHALEKQSWYARALYFNLVVFVLMNALAYLTFSLSIRFIVVLMASLVWILFYSYWSIVHRKVSLKQISSF